jgi:hypothetical protein
VLVAVVLSLLSATLGVSEAKVTSRSSNTGNVFSAGTLSLVNSKNGTTVIGVSSLMPAGSANGTLTLRVQGDYRTALTVAIAGISDTPSSPALSHALTLLIEDTTSTAQTLWSGTMSNFSSVSVGTFAAGTTRSLRFTVTFPAGNAVPGLQGAATTLTVRFTGVSQ